MVSYKKTCIFLSKLLPYHVGFHSLLGSYLVGFFPKLSTLVILEESSFYRSEIWAFQHKRWKNLFRNPWITRKNHKEKHKKNMMPLQFYLIFMENLVIPLFRKIAAAKVGIRCKLWLNATQIFSYLLLSYRESLSTDHILGSPNICQGATSFPYNMKHSHQLHLEFLVFQNPTI